MNEILSVRELEEGDIVPLSRYWFSAEPSFLKGMGVDLAKMPKEQDWVKMLAEQIRTPIEQKQSYCIIWEVDKVAVGHSNINKIIFGQEAAMHLHLWNSGVRSRGMGTQLVKMTIPFFFKKYHLQTLYCEPYALNPAPNRTLERVGFEFVKEYVTVPGWINFEQPVKRWEMTYQRYTLLGLDTQESKSH